MTLPSSTPRLTLVLDTNVVIDWLVFDDPFMSPLREGVACRNVCVFTHAAAIVELERVMGYPALKLAPNRQASIVGKYLAQTSVPPLPPGFSRSQLLTPAGFPQCRDPDDQHFLALAFHTQSTALVSRDKAVLKLRRRARKFGVHIHTVAEMITLLRPAQTASSGGDSIQQLGEKRRGVAIELHEADAHAKAFL
jgi:predicted nucleic acid-binding protein